MSRRNRGDFLNQKTLRTPPKQKSPVDESVYQCELCLTTDNQDIVRCDICHLWYHFKCVNVTSDVANQHWACMKCEGSRKQSTPTTKTSVINQDESLLGAAGQTSEQVPPTQAPIDLSTANASTVNKPPRSQKSVSISSSVSRRKALLLQRLEEEREMLEKRDQEYLNKKYSLLDLDTDDDNDHSDEELNVVKRDRTQQWSAGIVNQNQPVSSEPLDTNPSSNTIAISVSTSEITNTNRRLNRSESLQQAGTTQNKSEKQRRLSQGSNKSLRKVKATENRLPSWLSKQTKTLTNLFPWKVSSPVSMPASTTISTPAIAMLSSTVSMPASTTISTPAVTMISEINTNVNQLSLNGNPFAPPKGSNFFFKSNEMKQSDVLPSNNQPKVVMTNRTPLAIPPSTVNQTLASVPMNTQSFMSMVSIHNQSHSLTSMPVSAQSHSYTSMPVSAQSHSYTSMPVSVQSHSYTSMPVSVQSHSYTSMPISAQSHSYTSMPISAQSHLYTSMPVNVYDSQPIDILQVNSNPTSSSVMSSANDQTFHFGLRPPSANVTGSNSMLTAANMHTNRTRFEPFDRLRDLNPTGQQNQSIRQNVTPSSIYGGSSVYVNHSPVMTTGRASSYGQSSVALTASQPNFLVTDHLNPINGSMDSYAQSSNVNQNFTSGHANPVGMAQADVNDSMTSTHRVRLTAEQIASRHVIPKLPEFSGDPRQWQGFISAYNYATEACGFSNVENLGRIRASLTGEAKDAVGGRLLHPNSVKGVMETLELMFGRPELIIEVMIDDIKKIPTPKDDDLASLIKFAIAVQNLCSSIRETGALEHLRNPTLMNSITEKLPTQIQLNWAYHRHAIGVVDLSNLGDWLYSLANIASQVVRRPITVNKKKDKDKKDSEKKDSEKPINYLNAQIENKSGNKKCLACKSDSCAKLTTCKKLKSWSRSERWSFVKENKLCPRCFGQHSFYRCRSNQSCNAEGCTKKHHTLLHDNGNAQENSKLQTCEKPTSSENKKTDSKGKGPSAVCNSQRSTNNRTDIFRIVPIVLYNKDKVIRDFAYLDDGSNLTLMEDELANQLGLVGSSQTVCIDWAFGQSHESEDSRIVTTKISGFYHQAPSYKLENVRTVRDLNLPTQSITSAWLERYDYLRNIPIATYDAVKPRMLIGLQYSKLMVSMETVEGAWNEPIACRTRLGWVIQGPSFHNDKQVQKKFSLNLCQCQSVDNQLHQMVKEYFSIENFGVKISDKFLESKDVQRARKILESTTVKKDGRYESGLLWKYDEIDLPNSYNMAFKRLQCLESKMAKNPQLADNLCKQIEDMVDKGYIRKLSPSELQENKDRVWYLPIFPVFNPKKPEKIRIVWDAAAKVKNVSLNSMLLTGPDLLVPLVDILRRFRERLIAILADIKEMYHQIKIILQDQHSQRFLWRGGDPSKEPEIFVVLVCTFGAACSPCTAQFVKNKNANEYEQKYPQAVAAITHNTYVDDLLDCAHEIGEAIKLAKNVKFINQQGGFETRNFLSNSKQLLEAIGEIDAPQHKNLNINTDSTLGTERVLGMFWNTETDMFTYSLKYTKVNQKIVSGSHCPTKREVLRVLMSIFDPLGLLANFLIHGKILLQEIWRSNIEWDDQIPTTIQTKWIKWITALNDVEKIQIPRLYSPKLSPGTPNSIQLHIFVDAGVEAFAALAFYRITDDEGIDCCLVGAKTKVAPNKPMTVPRLELQAAVLGTRLSESIKKCHRLEIEKVVFWSDSKTVMAWLNSETRRYHQFVAFRVGEILELSELTEWKWVPSEHNVADDATKSKSIPKFDSSSRWFKGPKFLYDPEDTWFVEEHQLDYHTKEEIRPGFVMSCREGNRSPIVDVNRFSKWNRLVRAMAFVFRFIHNVKSIEKRTGPLTQEEIIRSENHLYRLAQEDHYLDEIAILKRNAGLPPDEQKYVEKSSDLYKRSPYLDDHRVLRVKGRLDAAKCLSPETKRPIILPRRHYITQLIVNHYHCRYLHLNHQTVLNEIKQKYDILGLRAILKEVRNSCQRCKNDSAAPQCPEMAELPYARLAAYERPFTYVGVDYFGPFKVKITRNCTASRWGVLYTCLTTRAIHLEVAHSLNTSSCIMAFERFTTACGHPRKVHSDNGSNFHGMENELKEEFKKLNQDELQDMFTNSEMTWSFNPPVSPHMGGAWERLISTVKSCFKKIVTTRNPTDETLPTLFANVENIVNSRPLTYVSLDSAEDEVLTPNHFLFGSSNGRKPLVRTKPKDMGKNDWINIQEQTNQFWRQFVLEYMPTLTKRTKWFENTKEVKAGDLVIIVDETNPRNTWPKAVVERTIVGRGGKRRQAIVRAVLETKNGPVHKEYRRSVHKLAVLDVKVPADERVNQQPVESINGGETVGQH